MNNSSNQFQVRPAAEVEFLEVEAIPTIVQKVTDYPMAEMATIFDDTFTELGPLLATGGIMPIGPAFSLHHRMPTDTATFEVGLPVSKPLSESHISDSGLILEASEIPAGSIARMSHVGPYDGLGEAWGTFMESVVSAGKTPQFPFWEIYVTEPSPDADPATLRTDLITMISG